MFEFLFKYPATVFSRGQFVLLAPWPVWLLVVAVVAAAGAVAWDVSRQRGLLSGGRPLSVWLLGASDGGPRPVLLVPPARPLPPPPPQADVGAAWAGAW